MFSIKFSGTVGYNINDWLLKNKDPLNQTVVGLLKNSKWETVRAIWESYVSAEDAPKGGGKKGGKRAKGGSFLTVSAIHREGNEIITLFIKNNIIFIIYRSQPFDG